MEAAELDVQLEELEIRLERLRALYEQYFLGIEKLEPTVARKDVDRRIYILRREKIRNTGKRFKLQTIIQRYNTFQQYWHRICREIENGTYKRHVLRAERNFGPQDLLTIAARRRFGRDKDVAASAAPSEPASAPPASAPPASAPPAAPSRSPIPRVPTSPPSRPPVPRAATNPAPAPSASRPAAAPPAAASPTRRAPERQHHFESLDLDMDFLGDWDPAASQRRAMTPPPPGAPPKAVEPARAAAPPKAPAPAPPPSPAASPPAASPPAASPPAVAESTAAALPKRAPAQPRPKAERPAAGAALDESRIRELHGRLNELKRKNQEAGQVSLEGLAKSLRATEEKLRKQHGNRRIDFDVVVKDGKAVVKPIIR